MVKQKNNPEKIHLIGIKGMAMSGLALMVKQLGYQVSGSDNEYTYATEQIDAQLKKAKIKVYSGFNSEHLKDKPDMVVVSSAYGDSNPEVKAAKTYHLTIKTHSEMLGEIMAKFEGIGVAGVHGKTTTSAMLAFLLKEAGFSPSYAIGAPEIAGLEGNAHIGDGKYFVAEADEYKKAEDNKEARFLDLPMKHVIITSIELDHPDVYDTAEDVYQAFYRMSVKIPRLGSIVACVDSPLVRRLVSRLVDRTCLTYGYGPSADYQLVNFRQDHRISFSIKSKEQIMGPFEAQILGTHNALNAAAVVIMATQLEMGQEQIKQGLKNFKGVKRRFEYLGDFRGAQFYDDFAHHPTAIDYLIETARRKFVGKKITIVFQPHTYSRTAKLLGDFAKSLAEADKVVLLNVFASAREKSGYVTARDLFNELKKNLDQTEFRSSLDEAALYLRSTVGPDEVVFLVGAGDVYRIWQKINT